MEERIHKGNTNSQWKSDFTREKTNSQRKSELTKKERIHKEERQDKEEPRVVFEMFASAVTNKERVHKGRVNSERKNEFTIATTT